MSGSTWTQDINNNRREAITNYWTYLQYRLLAVSRLPVPGAVLVCVRVAPHLALHTPHLGHLNTPEPVIIQTSQSGVYGDLW